MQTLAPTFGAAQSCRKLMKIKLKSSFTSFGLPLAVSMNLLYLETAITLLYYVFFEHNLFYHTNVSVKLEINWFFSSSYKKNKYLKFWHLFFVCAIKNLHTNTQMRKLSSRNFSHYVFSWSSIDGALSINAELLHPRDSGSLWWKYSIT